MRLRHPALCDKVDKTQSGRQAHGRQKQLQGIALIGAITGIAGLVMVLYEKKDEPESRQNAQKRNGRRFTSAIFQSSIVGMEILSVPWASNSAI